MKSKLIMICVCLGMLGITFACSGEDKATTANAESATPQSESLKRPEPAVKPAKKDDRPAAKVEDSKAKEGEPVDYTKLTNGECFPDSLPDSAPQTARLCIGLVKSAPDMPFTRRDFEEMPEECKPYVLPRCR